MPTMTCRTSKLTALAAALVLASATFASAGSGPCVKEAKRDAKDCSATCTEDFQTAKDGCLNRDHDCVEVCRANRSQCRLDSGIDAAIDACDTVLEARRAQCRADNPEGPARDACIDAAQVDAFKCRDSARELARPLLRKCRKDFRSCARACPAPAAGTPPVDVKACLQDATTADKACGAACTEDYQVAKDDCHHRDHDCMEQCREDRNQCDQPVDAILASDLATCASNRQTGVDGCTSQFPPPRDVQQQVQFDECVDVIQVDAFICRDDAQEQVQPGYDTCKQDFRTCVVTNCPVQTP
jgi:hypothetical protein